MNWRDELRLKMWRNHVTQKELAQMLGVTEGAVSSTLIGRNRKGKLDTTTDLRYNDAYNRIIYNRAREAKNNAATE